ncbi:MAG: beta-ketoacyl-[acyl-carrier-protein] synthase II [Chloroflexi bacterium]|nr:beta-ketoacyl-[acyl-carrier-protein] synthase II [Chloroflexota bacterium]
MAQVNPHAVRVVITGMGVICPLGNDVETLWSNLLAGKSGAGPITRFDASPFLTRIACEIKDFDPEKYMERRDARRLDLAIQYSLAAATGAMEQSRLKVTPENATRIGVLVGTGIGGLSTIEEGIRTMLDKGPMRVSPLTSAMMLPDMSSGQISISFGLKGPNFCIMSACATSGHTLGEASEIIRRGDADVMLAGGTEAAIVPFGVAAFHRTGALSTRNDDPLHASRPFDAQRDGFVFGEGAAILVLERLEHAQARNAPIFAELTGYGSTADAYHISAPAENGEGATRSMQMALRKAGLTPEEIDYINAHGTSTQLNDKSETVALKRAFGEYAYKVPISSTKSMVGHLLGAAGTVEAIASVMTILTGIIHPTINYEYPDPDCDLDYVPNSPRKMRVRTVLSNSFGFGGHNTSLVFKAYEPEAENG